MEKGDTEQFMRSAIDPLLSKHGKKVSRALLILFRSSTVGLLGWLAVKPSGGGITQEEFMHQLSVHEARCEQVIVESREQIKELNRRIDVLLRQRWSVPPRGGENLMRKDNE